MRKINKYYSLEAKKDKAVISIYGDITSYPYNESDVSSYSLSKQLDKINAKTIEVYINSYGGEVAEGLAIYNALKRHKAKVITYVDGFACSIASVIAMAGDERYMYNTSLLMIHNAWAFAAGNANDMRKMADDLDIMTSSIIKAYHERCNMDEADIKALLDAETWLTAEDALDKGFATKIADTPKEKKQSANARNEVYRMILKNYKNAEEETTEEETTEQDINEQLGELSKGLKNLTAKIDSLISILSEEETTEEEDTEEETTEEETIEETAEETTEEETTEEEDDPVARFITAIKNLK